MLYKYSNHFKFVLMIIAGLLASSMTIVMAYMVQTLTNGNFLLIVLTGYVLSFLASLVFNRLKTSTIKEVNTYLRIHIFKGMLNQSVEENTNSLGFLTSDFKLLETNRFNAQIEILMQGCTLLMALGYALVVNWLVTLLFLVGSFVPMLVSSLFQKAIQSASENWTKANSDYVNQTKNFLAGSQTLRLYGKQDNATKKNQIQVLKLESALRKMNLLDLDTGSWINLLASSVTFLVPFLVGIYMVIKGLTTLGALFAIVQLANSFVNPILIILEDRNKLSTTKKIVEKINTYLTLAEKKQNKNKEKVGDLTFTDIALKRKDKQFIEGLNLTIKVGSKQAIIGPSGMGKSTLLQFMMYGSFGKAEQILLNQKLKKAGTFTDIFAYASQASVIFADSLWFNLTLGANIARDKVLEVCEKLDLISLVKEKGFEYYLGNNADQLSGGQLERIELARAILANRPILLLDEINASLDKKISDEIHQYLLNSNLTFVEVIHHYNNDELNEYDGIIDLNDYKSN